MKFEIKFLENEGFFGLAVNEGTKMPLLANHKYSLDLRLWHSGNQASSSLISNKGRYIYSKNPFKVEVDGDRLLLEGEDIVIKDTHQDLKTAYKKIVEEFYVSDKRTPNLNMFEKPQYNTWIEMGWDCTQEKVLKYAHQIIEQGYPTGVLMIDDCWCKDYGVWDFDKEKFPDARAMVDELHSLGFIVMLWICPFISSDSPTFRELENTDLMVKIKGDYNENAISHWWNGYSCVLNFNNPKARKYFENILDKLQHDYAIDGFKLDAGDPEYYPDNFNLNGINRSFQAYEYAKLGEKYEYNELRVSFNNSLRAITQRLRDKNHSWDYDGINTLIPNGILEGLCGYPFFCPDMIGGGMILDFNRSDFVLDEELYVRYAQVSALMPMMQFSLLPWKVLSIENQRIVKKSVNLHLKYSTLIKELALKAADSGEPIIRSLIYEFGNEEYLQINDEFLLGSEILVAPMVKKGRKRTIVIPEGSWSDDEGKVYQKGTYEIDVPLNRLPIFKKVYENN